MPNSFIPIVNTTTATALALANKILGSSAGITVSSATYVGSVNATSTFDSFDLGSIGSTSLSLGSGVLLTSGSGKPALTNTLNNYSVSNNVGGDSKLDTYAKAAFSGSGVTADASILEIKFTIAKLVDGSLPKVSLDVMFGSDEYPEFSNSTYVDIAAVEFDGVNFAYFNNDKTQPLSVISKNLTLGNFIDNTIGSSTSKKLGIEYDGISSPLSITGTLNPALIEHVLRISIADTGDSNYDSGIFVSNFKSSSAIDTGISIISNVWIEVADSVKKEGNSGTTSFTFTVRRNGETTKAASVDWNVAGSGTNSASADDFLGGSLPGGKVNFVAGQTSATVTVSVQGDVTAEPDEGFTVTLLNPVNLTLGNALLGLASKASGIIQDDDANPLVGSKLDDFVVLQFATPSIVSAGSGNDTYLLSPFMLPAGVDITITDTQGSNSIQLYTGLSIAQSQVTNNAMKLILTNGSSVTVLGADLFGYDPGANSTIGINNVDLSYSNFVATVLGVSVPSATGAAITGPAVVIGGPVSSSKTVTLVAGSSGTVTGTIDAETFSFKVSDAKALTLNTQITINSFDVFKDKLQIDTTTAVGNIKLNALSGIDNIVVQSDPFSGTTIISFGPDADGDVIAVSLTGVTNSSLVNVSVI